MDYHIVLGTAGWGVWHSPDAGKSWVRHRKPFPLNSRIQSLAVLPGEPRGLMAAGDTGLFASHDGGASWARIGAQGDIPTIWSLAVDPTDPNTLFAGTRPAGVYRSRDGGWKWEQLDVAAATECAIGTPFVTRVLVDPDDRNTIWAGIEIDGVYRSLDGGDTWTRVVSGITDLDVHDVTIARTSPPRVLVSTNGEVFWSADRGETWTPIGVKAKWPLPYSRGIVVKTDDPRVLYRRVRRDHHGRDGRRAPLERRRADLAELAAARPAQRHDVGPGDPSRRRRAASWRGPSSARSTSPRTPGSPGARSRGSSGRFAPGRGCRPELPGPSVRRERM